MRSSGWEGIRADTRGSVSDEVTPGCSPAPLCMHGRAFLILPVPPASRPGTFPSSRLPAVGGCHGGCFGTIVGVARGPRPRPAPLGSWQVPQGLHGLLAQPTADPTPSPPPSWPEVVSGHGLFLVLPNLSRSPRGAVLWLCPAGLEAVPAFGAGCSCPGRCQLLPRQHGSSVVGATRQQGRLVLQAFMALPVLPRRGAVPAVPAGEPAFAG